MSASTATQTHPVIQSATSTLRTEDATPPPAASAELARCSTLAQMRRKAAKIAVRVKELALLSMCQVRMCLTAPSVIRSALLYAAARPGISAKIVPFQRPSLLCILHFDPFRAQAFFARCSWNLSLHHP